MATEYGLQIRNIASFFLRHAAAQPGRRNSSGPLFATQCCHWIDSRGAPRRDRACNSRYQAKQQGTHQQHDWVVCIAVSPTCNNFVQAHSKRQAA